MKIVERSIISTCFIALCINLNAQSWTFGNNAAVLNPTSANLGIGTTSPAYKLDVVGTTQTEKLLVNHPTTTTNWNTLWQSGFYDSNDASNAPESSGWFWGLNMGHTSNDPNYRYGGQIAIRNSNIDPAMYFRCTNINGEGTWAKVLHNVGNQTINGNLGVGVFPEERFHILGKIRLEPVNTANGISYSYLNWGSQNLVMGSPVGYYVHNAVELKPGGAAQGEIFSQLRLYTATAPNQQTLKVEIKSDGNIFFNNNGNFGIGTSNPYYKLDVNGTIRAREVIVNLNTGADFVFDKNYTLKSLDEVDNFIQTNKHLPEIPSASDMVNNGLDMGEFQIKLLQKIEELTLYVIEQNKQLKLQQQEIERLKRK